MLRERVDVRVEDLALRGGRDASVGLQSGDPHVN